MSRHDNYPDDIRQFDNVPGSPFYEEPEDEDGEYLEDEGDHLYQLKKDRELDEEIE